MKGTVVRATAGRDLNRFFVVLNSDGKYASIADGKTRKLEKPKNKSLKHLKSTNTVIETEDLTNRKLRKALAPFNGDCAVLEP